MRKIPTLFAREGGRVIDEVTPGCEWVLEGHGKPTRKYDGTCVCFVGNDTWWSRRQVRPGRPEPVDFVLVEADERTGKRFGWEPASQSPFVRPLAEALGGSQWPGAPGTYELCGPKINGNPEGLEHHTLFSHLDAQPINVPDRTFWGLRRLMLGDKTCQVDAFPHEGIVFHHHDGRMAKIKRRDFPA